ncbi:MAG: AEC family transporter [Xenococcaceae cyanobacterium MO_207.B15]|nr:AEC family transporter [Xenococcaceae cyanobacterium MO_207.B15]
MTTVFLALALITLIGSLLRYLFPQLDIDQLRKSLNLLVLYIFLPALIFRVVYTSSVGEEFYKIPIAIASGIISCLILGIIISYCLQNSGLKQFKNPASESGALLLAGAFGNVTYVGLPVLIGLFPDVPDIAKIAILAEITTASLNLVVGSSLAYRFSSLKSSQTDSRSGKLYSVLEIIKPVLKLPALWAVIIALLIKFVGLVVPEFILQASHLLGNTVSGLMMLSLGMSLRYQRFKHLPTLLITAIIKLLVSPLVVFGVVVLLQFNSPYFEAVVLEAAMPTQLLTIAIADRFQLDTRILAQSICFNTLMAFFTLPLVQYFLR